VTEPAVGVAERGDRVEDRSSFSIEEEPLEARRSRTLALPARNRAAASRSEVGTGRDRNEEADP
jgi:hypothetical protein